MVINDNEMASQQAISILKTAMKKAIFCLLTFSVVLCSCGDASLKRSSEEVLWQSTQYKLEITDTLHVPYLATQIQLYDTSPDKTKHLIMSTLEGNEFAVIDNEGQVLAIHRPTGQGEGLAGEFIFSLGFVGNDQVVVNSTRGYFIYDAITTDFIGAYHEKTALKGFGGFHSLNIESFEKDGELHFASFLKGTLDDIDIFKFKKADLDVYEPITFMNTVNNEISTNFGVTPTSLYRRHDYHFEQLYSIFDFNPEKREFVVLNNPSDELSIWNEDSELIKEIPFRPEHFKLPYRVSYGHTELSDAAQIVNSKFTAMKLSGNQALLSYRAGLTEEDYNALSSYAELPQLFKQKMHNYAFIVNVETGEVTPEFKLPKTAVGIAAYNSNDDVILYTSDELETESTFAFYRARIVLEE